MKPKDNRAKRDTGMRSSRSEKGTRTPPIKDEEGRSVFLRQERVQDRRNPSSDRREHEIERRRYEARMTPTRTLYVGGIGKSNTKGNTDKVRDVFKAHAKIEDVRMCACHCAVSCLTVLTFCSAMMHCEVDVRTIEEAGNLILEHRYKPFRYGGRQLRINFAEPKEDDPGATNTLFTTGFAGGEQHVRDLLKDWENAISNVRGGMCSHASGYARD